MRTNIEQQHRAGGAKNAKKKKWQKSKSIFWAFLGSAVLAGAVALFFF
jgi:hypothetical protein